MISNGTAITSSNLLTKGGYLVVSSLELLGRVLYEHSYVVGMYHSYVLMSGVCIIIRYSQP